MPVEVSQAEISAVLNGNVGGRVSKATFARLMPKFKAAEVSLDEIAALMRAAGFLGKSEVVREVAAAGRNMVAEMRSRPLDMADNRLSAAAFMVDVGLLQTAAHDLLRFAPPVANAPDIPATAQRLLQTDAGMYEEFRHIQNWFDGAADVSHLGRADLGLVCNFGYIAALQSKTSDLSYALSEACCTAARLARSAGLTVRIIPDFIFPLLQERPEFILSFHTSGRFNGFMHFKRADLPDYVLIDPGGYSGWSSLSGCVVNDLNLPEMNEAAVFVEQHFQEVISRNISKYQQPHMGMACAPLPKSFVFVALQVPNDRTQQMARFTMERMLNIVVNRFRNTDVAVVVKPHPKAKAGPLTAILSELSEQGLIEVRHDSIHDLLDQALAVITVNSGVGSEAMMYKKPIYTFGASDYDAVTHRITSVEQFHDLTTPIRPAVSEEKLVRFIAYYRQRYLVDRSKAGLLDRALQERLIEPILRARSV